VAYFLDYETLVDTFVLIHTKHEHAKRKQDEAPGKQTERGSVSINEITVPPSSTSSQR
jgi:hypothetical protein